MKKFQSWLYWSFESITASASPAPFDLLPDELLLAVLELLPAEDLARAAAVSRRLRRLVNTDSLWARLLDALPADRRDILRKSADLSTRQRYALEKAVSTLGVGKPRFGALFAAEWDEPPGSVVTCTTDRDGTIAIIEVFAPVSDGADQPQFRTRDRVGLSGYITPRCLAVHRGTLYAAAGGRLFAIGGQPLRIVAELSAACGQAKCIAIWRDHCVTGYGDGFIRVWSPEGRLSVEIPDRKPDNQCSNNPNKRSVFALCVWDDALFSSSSYIAVAIVTDPLGKPIEGGSVRQGAIVEWDPSTGREVREMLGHVRPVRALLADRGRLFSASLDRTVRIWAMDRTCIRTVQTDRPVMGVCLWRGLVVAAQQGDRATVWRTTGDFVLDLGSCGFDVFTLYGALHYRDGGTLYAF